MTSAARKAWNEAMKATAGAAALPASLQVHNQKRRSDRHKSKSERRAKARRVLLGDENEEFRMWIWIDALEGVDPSKHVVDDDEEFNEITEMLDDNNSKKRKASGRGRGAVVISKKKAAAGAMPKRILPRSLGSILLEDMTREDGATSAFLVAEARIPQGEQILPRRKFCPVTGLLASYTEPKSGIPFANMTALEQIQERPPPWMTLSGNASYWETVKSIQEE